MATSDVREQLQTALGAQYTLERELGRGGMATVYLAQDTKHHRAVALKVLHGPPPSGADLALLATQLLTAGDTSGARDALRQALARGARAARGAVGPMELNIPAIEGIGGSYLYLVDRYGAHEIYDVDFVPIEGAMERERSASA